jgi:sulfoxide reductase heme-binding subunit YedZ
MLNRLKQIWDNPYFFWILISLPSIPMVLDLFAPVREYGHLMHGSGEFSARFLVITLLVTPFMVFSNGADWARWLMRRRRYLGVAAFGYALLHTLFYIRELGTLSAILAEFLDWGILTGWIAFFIFIPLTLTSNNTSVRKMGPKWKSLQRLVYISALFTAVHWVLIGHIPPALVHFVPLTIAMLVARWRKQKRKANFEPA